MAINHVIYEHKGHWWEPTSPENKYFGSLKIDEFGIIIIEVLGSKNPGGGGFDILYGVTDEKIKITVFSKYRLKSTTGTFFKSTVEFRYCLIGCHFQYDKEIKFKEIKLNLLGFFGWFPDIQLELLNKRKEKHYIEHTIYQGSNREISFEASNDETFSMTTKRTEIQTEGYLKIKYKNDISIHELFEELKNICMLMSILGREPAYIQEIVIPSQDNFISKSSKLHVNNQTYFTPTINRDAKDKLGQNVLVQQFDIIFAKLYEMDESTKFIVEVLSESYFRRVGNERISFFNAVSAFESWHRTYMCESDPANIEKYNDVVNALQSEPELVSWLKNMSTVLRGMSLPKRLDYLISLDELEFIKDKKSFKKIVSDTRNMIAHNLKKPQKSGNLLEIIAMTRIIIFLLEFEFLKTLGVSNEYLELHKKDHPRIADIDYLLAVKDEIRF